MSCPKCSNSIATNKGKADLVLFLLFAMALPAFLWFSEVILRSIFEVKNPSYLAATPILLLFAVLFHLVVYPRLLKLSKASGS